MKKLSFADKSIANHWCNSPTFRALAHYTIDIRPARHAGSFNAGLSANAVFGLAKLLYRNRSYARGGLGGCIKEAVEEPPSRLNYFHDQPAADIVRA